MNMLWKPVYGFPKRTDSICGICGWENSPMCSRVKMTV